MILAGICSALFSFATPVAAAGDSDPDEQTVKVPSWCDVGNPGELSTQIKSNTENATKKELEDCLNKVSEKTTEKFDCIMGEDSSCEADYQKLSSAENELADAIIAKQVSLPTEDFIKTPEIGVTDISAKDNQCICVPTGKEGDKCTDANNIIAVVEEPMETELTNTDQTKVRTCTRNTFCVEREEGKEMKCVTYLNAKKSGTDENAKYEPFCSTQASNYMKDNPGKASLYCQPVQVFLSSTGTDLLFVYISTIYKWAASVIGIIAVLVIVISGIQISAAAGEQQAVTNAKNRIIQSLGGLALLFLSAIILYTINPNFFTAG